MTVHVCPVCGVVVRVLRPGLILRDQPTPGVVCANGHKITKALKRHLRARRIAARAAALGLTEAAYRAGRDGRPTQRGHNSPLFVAPGLVPRAVLVWEIVAVPELCAAGLYLARAFDDEDDGGLDAAGETGGVR